MAIDSCQVHPIISHKVLHPAKNTMVYRTSLDIQLWKVSHRGLENPRDKLEQQGVVKPTERVLQVPVLTRRRPALIDYRPNFFFSMYRVIG